jgi:hypothetical protein
MAFCTAETITASTTLNKVYSPSVLPSASAPRDQNGNLTVNALNTIYNGLIGNGKLFTVNSYQKSLQKIGSNEQETREQVGKTLPNVGVTEKATMDGMKNEFCHYYNRYKYSLNDLFSVIATTSSGSTLTSAQQTTINTKLDVVKGFNTKLNDLVQITNFIATQRASEMGSENTDINALNTKIKATYGKLASHNATMRKETAIGDLRKQMVEFSQEKNLSANNLLAFYGFLNLVSIGLLFYIYRK